jgi:hypothetical protein
MGAIHSLPHRIQEASQICLKCPCPYYFTGPHPSTRPHSCTPPYPTDTSWCQYRQSHLPNLSLYLCLSTTPFKSCSVIYRQGFVTGLLSVAYWHCIVTRGASCTTVHSSVMESGYCVKSFLLIHLSFTCSEPTTRSSFGCHSLFRLPVYIQLCSFSGSYQVVCLLSVTPLCWLTSFSM